MAVVINVLGFAAFIWVAVLIHIKLWDFCEHSIEMYENNSNKKE